MLLAPVSGEALIKRLPLLQGKLLPAYPPRWPRARKEAARGEVEMTSCQTGSAGRRQKTSLQRPGLRLSRLPRRQHLSLFSFDIKTASGARLGQARGRNCGQKLVPVRAAPGPAVPGARGLAASSREGAGGPAPARGRRNDARRSLPPRRHPRPALKDTAVPRHPRGAGRRQGQGQEPQIRGRDAAGPGLTFLTWSSLSSVK